MKAWTLTAHGDPKKVLELRDHPDPSPGDNQVLIRCAGFGLNYADVMAVKGLYREAPPTPSIIGYEVVGRVEQCGAHVPSELKGKRVVAMTRFGGYAEQVVTDHRACAVIPEELPLGHAAAMATQGVTAWYSARMVCPLQKGERVLIHSAAGGVGQLLVQLALERGCEVYGVAKGAAKMEFLRTLGVQHPIDRGRGDVAEQVNRTLGAHRIDVSFNAVGGSSFKKDMALLGSGGRIVLFGGSERGSLGALGTLRFVWRMGLVVPIFLMMKSQSIIGVNMLRISDHHPERIAACLDGIISALRSGAVKPHVHAEYGREKLPDALEALAGGGTIGKVVVKW